VFLKDLQIHLADPAYANNVELILKLVQEVVGVLKWDLTMANRFFEALRRSASSAQNTFTNGPS
jgi:hypothetical protein